MNHQDHFAQTLLDMARRDAARAVSNPADRLSRSVALWMSEQLRAYAATVTGPSATPLGQEARALRDQVIRATSPLRRTA